MNIRASPAGSTSGYSVNSKAELVVYLSPRQQLTAQIQAVSMPQGFLIATDEDIDNLFKVEEEHNG